MHVQVTVSLALVVVPLVTVEKDVLAVTMSPGAAWIVDRCHLSHRFDGLSVVLSGLSNARDEIPQLS